MSGFEFTESNVRKWSLTVRHLYSALKWDYFLQWNSARKKKAKIKQPLASHILPTFNLSTNKTTTQLQRLRVGLNFLLSCLEISLILVSLPLPHLGPVPSLFTARMPGLITNTVCAVSEESEVNKHCGISCKPRGSPTRLISHRPQNRA